MTGHFDNLLLTIYILFGYLTAILGTLYENDALLCKMNLKENICPTSESRRCWRHLRLSLQNKERSSDRYRKRWNFSEHKDINFIPTEMIWHKTERKPTRSVVWREDLVSNHISGWGTVKYSFINVWTFCSFVVYVVVYVDGLEELLYSNDTSVFL